jgi:hypothetical protein
MNVAQLYNEWGIPFIRIGSGCLVSRENAVLLIERLYQDGYCFLGYDAFTVLANGSRQPHLEFSASYSAKNQPTLSQAIESLIDDPSNVSHYEFIFKTFTSQIV